MVHRSTIRRRRLKVEDPERYALELERKNARRRKDPLSPRRKGKNPLWREIKAEQSRARKKARRLAEPEKVRAERKASYLKHKEKEKKQHLEWSRRPEVSKKRLKYQADLKKNNPAFRDLQLAKGIIARALGISQKIIPLEVAGAKAALLRLDRAVHPNDGRRNRQKQHLDA
jgi:hypothetical protein